MTLRDLKQKLDGLGEAWLDGEAVVEWYERGSRDAKSEVRIVDVLDDGSLVGEDT